MKKHGERLRYDSQQMISCPNGCNTFMLWWKHGEFECPMCKRAWEVVSELKEVQSERVPSFKPRHRPSVQDSD